MFDYLYSQMHCPLCGHKSGPGESIGMQTKLRGNCDGSTLQVGDELEANDLRRTHLERSGYLLLNPRVISERICLLNTWTCPSCEREQWGIIKLIAGKITSIESVQMTAAVLRDADFIDAVDAELLAAALLGMDSLEFVEKRIDPVEVLRQHLPD